MLGVGTASHSCLRSYEQGAHMWFVSDRAIVMRPLLAALASVGLFSQLCVSGCAVGPSYRKPATTLEKFHSGAALQARPTSAPTPALETWWDGFHDPMLRGIVALIGGG
ncbi:MAG: efflux system outer rane lipoprotein [Gammaproteobacteria bacterium]|nr:efflux system outer rane lipoprotein [Gammaproteobacteria bacterium]